MNRIRKYIIFSIIVIFFSFPIVVKAVPGCCSWHGGEAGCVGNKTLCADGTISSCSCDGTNSSINGNSTTSNNKKEPVSPWFYIIGLAIAYGGFYVFAQFLDFCSNANKNRYNKQRQKREKEYREQQEELQKQKERDVENIIDKGNDSLASIDEIDDQSIVRFTSDDLIQIINSKNDNIFTIIDKINDKKNGFTERYIFDELCCKILENKKLSSLQNKCVKYIFDKKLINDYEKIFFITLENRHITLLNYMMNNCKEIKFNFNKFHYSSLYSYTDYIFEILLDINDLSLTEKIAKNNNFSLNIGTRLFEKKYDHNDEYKYQLLSVFANNKKYLSIDVEGIFERKIKDCNDDEIIKVIDFYSKINGVLEEKGYYLVYLLIKKQNINCIQYMLDNYKNINLDKHIKSYMDEKINGFTPLTYACYRKSNKIVEILLNYGADGNFPDINEDTPLAYACYLKSLKLIKLLYEKGYRFKNEKDNISVERYLKEKEEYLLPIIYVRKLYKLTKNKR